MFPSNDLEAVMASASRGATGPASVLSAVVRSDLVVPVSNSTDDGGTLAVLTIDNRAYVKVFSSHEQADAAGEQGPFRVIAAKHLLSTLPGHVGFAVNVGGDLGMPVFAESLRQAIGMTTQLSTGARIRIGHPATEPDELEAALASHLVSATAVVAGRRCWASIDEAPAGLVLGLDVDPDSPDTRQQALRAVDEAVRQAAPDFTVDVVFTNDNDTFTGWMSSNTTPFFVRGTS